MLLHDNKYIVQHIPRVSSVQIFDHLIDSDYAKYVYHDKNIIFKMFFSEFEWSLASPFSKWCVTVKSVNFNFEFAEICILTCLTYKPSSSSKFYLESIHNIHTIHPLMGF